MFLLIGPITFVMSLDRTAMTGAAPTIQHEYGFSLVEMSWILTSFSWTYALLQVPAFYQQIATGVAATRPDLGPVVGDTDLVALHEDLASDIQLQAARLP